jgi:hypothetical protein
MVSFDSKTTGVEVNGRREGWYVSLLIYGWPSVVEDYFLFIMLGVRGESPKECDPHPYLFFG